MTEVLLLHKLDDRIKIARAIATIVLGSQGILVTPVAVPSRLYKAKSLWRVLRDYGRSVPICYRCQNWSDGLSQIIVSLWLAGVQQDKNRPLQLFL